MRTIISMFFFLSLITIQTSLGGENTPNLTHDFEPRTILVGMAKSVMSLPGSEAYAPYDRCTVSETINQLLAKYSPTSVSQIFPGIDSANYPEHYFVPQLECFLAIHFAEDFNIQAVTSSLSELNGVLFAEPNYYVQLPAADKKEIDSITPFVSAIEEKVLLGPPNDTVFWGVPGGYGDQWNLHNDGFGIGCEQAWAYTTGDSTVRIGILETGLWWNHPDLNVVDGFRVVPGYFSPYKTIPADTTEYRGHPTNCAGIIGASTNNNFGIAGIAGGDGTIAGCSILDLQLDQSFITSTLAAWAFAITTAADPLQPYNCDVISMSITTTTYSETLRVAVRFAHSVGVNVVSSNGNHTTPPLSYPAGFDEPWVFAVGAFDTLGIARYSSNDSSLVDILGPGSRCPATSVPGAADTTSQLYQDHILDFFGATSCATPHVAGSIGLLRSLLGNNLAPEDYENILKLSSVNPVDNNAQTWNVDYGHGRLHVGAAVKNAADWAIQQYSTQKTIKVDSTYVNIKFASGPYSSQITPAIRYKISGSIKFSDTFLEIPKVWGPCQPAYPFGFHGFSIHSPNYGEPFHGIEEGSVTLTGCDVYTYTYKIWNEGIGNYDHWYPAPPSQIPVTVKALGPLTQKNKVTLWYLMMC